MGRIRKQEIPTRCTHSLFSTRGQRIDDCTILKNCLAGESKNSTLVSQIYRSAAAAFVTTKENPDINQPTIDYVEHFVPDEVGDKFNPHVTIGVGTKEYLDNMMKEKFEPFTFSPVGVSVYHLGDFGTAREELKTWELKP